MLKGQIGPEGGAGVSFGVAFGSRSSTETVGRRIATREFAGQEEPATQDLGRASRRYRIDAVLVGADYVNQYNALIDELERPGRKLLRHPIHGDRIVRVPAQEMRMSLVSTGTAEVSFDLIEAGARDTIVFLEDETPVPVETARELRDEDFQQRVNMLNEVGEFAEGLANKVQAANSTLRGVKQQINARLSVVDDIAVQIALLDENIVSLAATPQQIANTFGNLARQIFDLVGTAAALFADDAARILNPASPIDVILDSAEAMASFGADDDAEPLTTPQRIEYAESLHGIRDMVRMTGAIEAASILSGLTFDSGLEARTTRTRMAAVVDAALAGEGLTVQAYDALQACWSALESTLSRASQKLPQVHLWRVPETMPALLVAHEIYGDARRCEEIIRRNRHIISNPNFVPGGVDLEVLGV